MSNGFLSQKALVNNLYRHYTREGLKEAHKVLGGAGPAVASVRGVVCLGCAHLSGRWERL